MKKKIKLNSLVKIIYGKDKGKIGKVIKIIKNKDFIYVKNIKLIKKYIQYTDNMNKFSKIENIESKIHISNVILLE